MALPIKTTADDVRKVVGYFKNKPTGATLEDAKAAIDKRLLDRRKMSAYKTWGVLQADGERFKLTTRAREMALKPEQEQAVFRQIIDSVKPYRSGADWMFHQELDAASVVDIAANWHEHHRSALGEDVADSTVRENALAFLSLAEAAGLGNLVVGRGGNVTRLVIDKNALKAYVEAGPSAPPWTDAAEEGTEPGGEGDGDEDGTEESGSSPPENGPAPTESSAAASAQEIRAFISHGKNVAIVEQVETMLELADIKSEIAEDEETTAIPVPDKVFDAMRRCTAGIIVCSVEESHKDSSGNYMLNDNVLIEIGAAFVLYEKRVVLLWDKRLPVPSNLQGLYRCEFEGDDLSWGAGMKLMKAIRDFKQ
jgi:hypothetical protein